MKHYVELLITAIAPILWGTTYYVATEHLPTDYPVTMSVVRALPASLFLVFFIKALPQGIWWWRSFVLGFFNFSLFWIVLFIATYRLPGGIAATLNNIQPLMVVFLSAMVLATPIRPLSIIATLIGFTGVGLMVLSADAQLDFIGIVAALIGALSMALGTIFTKKWQPDVPLLTFTAWQLIAGSILLLPLVFVFEPELPNFTTEHIFPIFYLSIIGSGVAYIIWFRAISIMPANLVSVFGFVSPLTAVLIGWIMLDQTLSIWQISGAILIVLAIILAQRAK